MPLSHILWKGYIKYNIRGETTTPGGGENGSSGGKKKKKKKRTYDTHDPQEYVNINYLKRDAAIWIESILKIKGCIR